MTDIRQVGKIFFRNFQLLSIRKEAAADKTIGTTDGAIQGSVSAVA